MREREESNGDGASGRFQGWVAVKFGRESVRIIWDEEEVMELEAGDNLCLTLVFVSYQIYVLQVKI